MGTYPVQWFRHPVGKSTSSGVYSPSILTTGVLKKHVLTTRTNVSDVFSDHETYEQELVISANQIRPV